MQGDAISPTDNSDAECRVPFDWHVAIKELGPRFAARAAEHDSSDTFVTDNLAELKEGGVFAAGIPAELGGGGASHAKLCEMLRHLAHCCGSTALTLSMHTHLVAAMVWRWRREPAAVETLLRRIVDERLLLVATGSSDWLNGSGTAQRSGSGWRITGRKRFCSGIPAGDYLMTSAICDNGGPNPTIIHFPLPVRAPGVRMLNTWHTLGMRGTGSNDVQLDGVFVPDSDILASRPQGKWHPLVHVATSVGLPLIFAVYLGIAEAARDLAVARARSRNKDHGLCYLIGEMENELAMARIAHADMVAAAAISDPGSETSNRIMTGRTLVGRAAMRTVEKAMEVVGGSGLYCATGLERHFRDIQGARYHTPQEKMQQHYAGCIALGLGPDD